MRPEINITKISALEPALKEEMDLRTQSEFGHLDIIKKYTWSKPDWTAYALVGEALVSFLNLVERTALVDGKQTKLVGINNVITLPQWRKRGFSTLAMNEASSFIFKKLDATCGLLLCSTALVPFYEGLGWQQMQCPVYFDQPGGKVKWESNVMVLPRNTQEKLKAEQADQIDLCGLPW